MHDVVTDARVCSPLPLPAAGFSCLARGAAADLHAGAALCAFHACRARCHHLHAQQRHHRGGSQTPDYPGDGAAVAGQFHWACPSVCTCRCQHASMPGCQRKRRMCSTMECGCVPVSDRSAGAAQ
eukprot:730421-Rhodomonas_salina.1